jgi:hypothetical protein
MTNGISGRAEKAEGRLPPDVNIYVHTAEGAALFLYGHLLFCKLKVRVRKGYDCVRISDLCVACCVTAPGHDGSPRDKC